MGDVLQFPVQPAHDAARKRFLARRARKQAELRATLEKGLAIAESIKAMRSDDLTMDHVDNLA